MLKRVATIGVFFYGLLLLAAEATAADAGSVTWERAFRPIYPEAASYPRATALSDGGVLVAFAHPTPVGKAIACVVSSDGGKSWGTPVTVAEKKGSGDGMSGVVRFNDQELLAVFEAQDVPPFRFVIRGVRSPDLGRTWSATRQLIYCPQNPVAAPWAAPVHLLGGPDDPANWNALYALKDGTVLALTNHRRGIWIKTGATDETPGR